LEIPKERIGLKGKVKWESPSNIALVKYWGKYGRQYPRNSSISFTLNNAKSITELAYEVLPEPSKNLQLKFEFEGKANASFENKIVKFLESVEDLYPYLRQIKMDLKSENTFPHSTGIASSASAMSALAMCILDMESEIFQKGNIDLNKASTLARLGSGSASRSIFPVMALWGNHDKVENSSNDFAIGYENQIHEIFKDFHDDILIVSKEEKSVSSTAGHALMDGNPYAEQRYLSAQNNIQKLLESLNSGALEVFIEIVEQEALTLHALMMCSKPSFILLKASTLRMIELIRNFREEQKIPVCFTLDAGPNIHLLYPDKFKEKISSFIEKDLKPLTSNGDSVLYDNVGQGPRKNK